MHYTVIQKMGHNTPTLYPWSIHFLIRIYFENQECPQKNNSPHHVFAKTSYNVTIR